MLGFLYRFMGGIWTAIGLLIAMISIAYILFFSQAVNMLALQLGDGVPILDWLAENLGPGLLMWWGVFFAGFLVILGMRLLVLSPASRPAAMSFHLLAGLFLIVIAIVLYMRLNQAGGIAGFVNAVAGDLGRTTLILGLFLGVLLIGIGISMGTEQAWAAFVGTGSRVRLANPEPWAMPGDAAPVGPTARLVDLTHDDTVYELKPGVHTTIGSSPDRVIRLSDSTVSAQHAHIDYETDIYLLYDEGSTNGTSVNGKKVIGIPARLSDGDEITIGRIQLRFEL